MCVTVPRSVALVLDAVQRVLEGGDQDLAPVVPGHLALLDQGDCCDQRFDGGGVLPGRCVLDGSGNGRA